jgi:hydrogenase expression/formation protein HypD
LELLNSFKDPKIVKDILVKLKKIEEPITIMEVCGTHTMSILKNGIKELLPKNIKLISGPGCPVCVTDEGYIDTAIELSKRENIIITTFGDLIRVPGEKSTLQKEKAIGRDIRVVYSPLDALTIAKENPNKEVVFLAVGFETTAPIIALSIFNAKKQGIKNFSVLNTIKTMPEAMKSLVLNDEVKIDGFLCPGHVSTIIGVKPFELLAKEYNIPLVIAGFEAVDIVAAIYRLVQMKINGEAKVENLYNRVVKYNGNENALRMINEVFYSSSSQWRGLGKLEGTGLSFNDDYISFNANKKFNIKNIKSKILKGCLCGEILRGLKEPKDCKMFKTLCNPLNPVGPCMVSEEGTCAAYYKYS